MAVLEVRSVTKKFGGIAAVNDISFAVEAGQIVGVIGPNGAGKTTLFHCITNFLPVTSGSVRLDGREITGTPPHQLVDQGLVRSFQKTTVFPDLTALEGLRCGMHARTRSGLWDVLFHTGRHRQEEQRTLERARELLEFVGLQDRQHVKCQNLSYGEQKLWALAVALAAEPRVLLLDEPAAGLNPTETAEMMELLLRIRERGITILLVEHNMALVMGVSDRVVAINFGQKIAEGTPEQVQRDPEVIAAYLGDGSFTALG